VTLVVNSSFFNKFLQGLQLPFQPHSITVLWLVLNYTAWWGMRGWTTCPGLLRESGIFGSQIFNFIRESTMGRIKAQAN